jgi:hypothetical protein
MLAPNAPTAPDVLSFSQVAGGMPPTVAALVTQAAGTVQPVVATSVAASRVQISQANVSQDDPTVTIRNWGSSAADIGGWMLALGPFLVVLPRFAARRRPFFRPRRCPR